MELVHGIVFDLDDTLYLEESYVLSGFKFVADFIGGDGYECKRIFESLVNSFRIGVRGNNFDRVLAEFPSMATRWNVEDLVDLYRQHSPVIHLSESANDLLTRLAGGGIKLALITDGPVSGQAKKIAALGLDSIFAPMILTDLWGVEFRKPHPRAYEAVMGAWNIPAERLVYIGDNPQKDFLAPRALGWQTARLRFAGQMRFGLEPASPEYAPSLELDSYSALSDWLISSCDLPKASSEGRCR
jgi:putative hydrolase of the HAD superfamily